MARFFLLSHTTSHTASQLKTSLKKIGKSTSSSTHYYSLLISTFSLLLTYFHLLTVVPYDIYVVERKVE